MNSLDIKKNRKNLGWSQEELAEKIGVSKTTIYNYERGKEIPATKKSLLISFFNFHNNVAKEEKSDYITNSNGNKFLELEDGSMNVVVDIIPFEAYASYTELLDNKIETIDGYEEVTFNVEKYGMGNYKAFRVKGPSMDGGMINDTPDGSLVLARELGRHHWMDGFNTTKYGWIILSKYNIFHKDIVGFNKDKGSIVCHSRNKSPEYADFELDLNDVYKIFKVIKRTF